MPRFPVICAAVAALSMPGTGLADEIAAGRDLATRWCTGCHIVGPGIRGGTVGPSFEAVAERPDRTRETLFNWMIAPHPPMPDVAITPQESSDLAAYILSLRK
jgi:mono/diheme cytochrome c family protein